MADHNRNPRGYTPGSRARKPAAQDAETASAVDEAVRLNKYIAHAGVCSRRKADALIDQELVKINGAVVREYWHPVGPGDVVEVNGRIISPRRFVYLLLNKPKDTITTTHDERGRSTVMDLVQTASDEHEGLYPVGRLDRDTTGILLLTNDGELAHRLMHPRYNITKRYVVRTRAAVKPHEIDQLRRGVDLEDGPAKADQAAYVNLPDHHEVGLEIHEGRNRQIRRMFEALGHEITALERVTYADLTSAGVRRGKWRKLFPYEVQRLRNLVHLK